jgi:hypothetical protein
VLEKLLIDGEIKVWKAREILEGITKNNGLKSTRTLGKARKVSQSIEGVGFGKVILLVNTLLSMDATQLLSLYLYRLGLKLRIPERV